MFLLIGLSIGLQVVCVGISGILAVQARNGSWRFWTAMTVAFIGIVIRRSMWLLDGPVAGVISIGATYLVSLAFLAAMVEAALFHRSMRNRVATQSENILELERRLEERTGGRTAT